ncbi:MAG: hypothetical protein M1365_17480 [Actinobacteria bacterium]|nr:hypothetical protein [Actinomycetota bacterium]
MIFKELINSVDYDYVWAALVKRYKLKDGAYEVYKSVLEELKILKLKPCKPPITLVVAKIENCLEPSKFIFDVFGIIKDDKNHYALEMTHWNEWLSFNVLDKSIEVYGPADVVAHSLYEMTFYGYSSKTVDEKVEKEKHILNKFSQEIQNSTAHCIDFEEAIKEINYFDKQTSEEKERKEYERITANNEKIYKMLLGSGN